MHVGSVIRIFETKLQKVKWFIVIADVSGELATLLINTDPKPQHLSGIQALQLPITQKNCPFLSHDSYVDCSEIHTRSKKEINEILQKDPGRLMGTIPSAVLSHILKIVSSADTIDLITKRNCGIVK